MEAFPHGDYIILDGTRDELGRIVEWVETADQEEDDLNEAIGKIRRGLKRGATKIAVTAPQAIELHRFLKTSQKEGADVFAREIGRGLEEGEVDSGIN